MTQNIIIDPNNFLTLGTVCTDNFPEIATDFQIASVLFHVNSIQTSGNYVLKSLTASMETDVSADVDHPAPTVEPDYLAITRAVSG